MNARANQSRPCAANIGPLAAKHATPAVNDPAGDRGASSAPVEAGVDALARCEASLFAWALICNESENY